MSITPGGSNYPLSWNNAQYGVQTPANLIGGTQSGQSYAQPTGSEGNESNTGSESSTTNLVGELVNLLRTLESEILGSNTGTSGSEGSYDSASSSGTSGSEGSYGSEGSSGNEGSSGSEGSESSSYMA